MLIPIRCVTCNNPFLASKWFRYQTLAKKYRAAEGRSESDEIEYLKPGTVKTAEGKALDELGLKRECCRARMLTHVDLL